MGFFLADVCGFKSLLLIGPRLALLVQSLAPPMAAVLSWVFLGESLALHHWAAMLVTISGVTWVVLERREAEPFVGDRRGWAQGMLLAVVSAIAQAVGMVLAREGIGEYDAVAATFIRAVGAMPAYLLLLSFLSRWPTIFLALRQTRIMVLVVAGSVIGPLAGVTLCMVALRECPAGVVTTIVNTTPVLVLPLTILLFGEQISLRAALGAVVSVAGIALMCWNG
jgi:drug/metabolite transporter (DMT)-like permease